MDTTNHYQIKTIDFCTSNYGYLLKVTMLDVVSEDHFKLAYIPFGKFPSVLMTEFLVSRTEGLRDGLLESLQEAIKKELEGQPELLLLAEQEKRTADISEGTEGIVPVDRTASLDEQHDAGHRLSTDHKFKVFREVFLGKLPQLRVAGVSNRNIAGYRIINDNQLYVDIGMRTGDREDTAALQTIHNQPTGVRDITEAMTVNKDVLQALREYTFNLLVNGDYKLSERVFDQNGLRIESMLGTGLRHITSHPTIVVFDTRWSTREKARNTTTQHHWVYADRNLNRRTHLIREIQAQFDNKRKTIIRNNYWFGRLLYKSYPALLHKEIQSIRDIETDLLLHHLARADKAIERRTFLNRDIYLGTHNRFRYIPAIYKAMLHNSMMMATRVMDNHKLFWEQPIQFGSRPNVVRGYVEREYSLGSRPNNEYIHIPREMPKGYRPNSSGLYVPCDSWQGKRQNESGLHLPREQQQGSRPNRRLYIDSVQHRAQRPQRDLYVPYDTSSAIDIGNTGGGGDTNKIPYPAFLDEGLLADTLAFPGFLENFLDGQKTVIRQYELIEEHVIAHVENTRNGAVHEETFGGELIKKVLYGLNMEDHFFASILRELPADLLEDIHSNMDIYADLMDVLFVGDRQFDGPGYIDPEYAIGVRERIDAIIESEIPVSLRTGREALIEQQPVFADGDILRPADIKIENPFGYFEAQPSILPDGLEALQEPKPSVIGGGLEASQEPKPSVLGNGVEAGQEPKPSVIGKELTGQELGKPGFIDQEIMGKEPVKPAFIGESVLGQEPERPATIGNEVIGQDQLRPATFNTATEGKKTEGGSVMDDELLGDLQQERPGTIGLDTQLSSRPGAGGTYEEILQGLVDLRPTDLLDDSLLGQFQKRMAELTADYILGHKPVDRAACIAEIYYLADTGIRDGLIEHESWINYATLALSQAIIGEQMFATNPFKASDLLEHILAFTDPFPTHMDADLIAKKQEHYSDLIGQLVGEKQLGQAVIQDYLVAQERIKEGYLPEQVIGKEELKKALLEQGTEAQSFIYDYNNDDLLFEGDDPEFWEEGFGIPEEYDPKDPFNPYYPWTEDLGTQELDVVDWIRFGSGTWDRDRQKYEFYSRTDVEKDGGYYRNDFSRTDYVFTIDFKVDEASDGGAGIVFRYTDDKNYTKFTVFGGESPTRHMTLSKMVNGTETWMGSPMNPFNWVQGQWYRLEVSVLENRIKIKVNGRLQYDLVD